MPTSRTVFKNQIVAEFMAPRRKSNKVIILCPGMPSLHSKSRLLSFYAKKGFWVFAPRYRGSWESKGQFLKNSPVKDILDVINGIQKGFYDMWEDKEYKVEPKKIYLFALSFGGPAGILLSRDPRVDKVIAVSPVVDWRAPSRAEPLDWLGEFVRYAFGEGYRFKKKDWNKLAKGDFYNPMTELEKVDGEKLFIIHAKNDESVGARQVERFAKKTGAKLKMLKRGGHLSSSILMKPSYYKQIRKFFDKKSS